jgi:hypothetical protein
LGSLTRPFVARPSVIRDTPNLPTNARIRHSQYPQIADEFVHMGGNSHGST